MPNFIGIYPKAFSDELCDDYVEWFKQKHKKFGTVNKQDGRDDVSIFAVNHGSAEELNNKARAILKDKWKHYAKKWEIGGAAFEDLFMEDFKIQWSYPDGGFYSWHTEQGRGEYSSNRMGVFMVYLNTVNKGGKTEFKHYELDVKPEKGTLIYWPASYTHRHRAAPDLKEDKYILTGWLSYSRKKARDGDNS